MPALPPSVRRRYRLGRLLAVSFFAIAAGPTPTAAADWQLSVESGYQLGSSSQEIGFQTLYWEYDVELQDQQVVSRPLDYWLVGTSLAWRHPDLNTPWEVILTARTNLDDPADEIRTEAWRGVAAWNVAPERLAEYRSRAVLRAYTVDVALWLHWSGAGRPWGEGSLSGPVLGLGYRHDLMEHEGYGLHGWYDDGAGVVELALRDGVLRQWHVAEHWQPFVALRLPLVRDRARLEVGAEARFLLTVVTELADFLQHHWQEESVAGGAGFSISSFGRVPVLQHLDGSRFLLGVRLEAAYAYAFLGSWEGVYYDDDLSTWRNDTGIQLSSGDYAVETWRGSFVLTADLEL